MKIELDHPVAQSANKSDKKKQYWELAMQPWKVQQETKGRFVPSICAFLDYAARCFIPVGYAFVSSKSGKGRVAFVVAVPITYRQLSAATGYSEATSSKILQEMKSIGMKYESQMMLMPIVNGELLEILDEELGAKSKASAVGLKKIFGAGVKSGPDKVSDMEPNVVSEQALIFKESAESSNLNSEEQPYGEENRERIARSREVPGSIAQIFF
jgi:hypothetical protein